jgi:hypothetical protein
MLNISNVFHVSTVKPQFIFIMGPEKERCIWEDDRYWSHSLNDVCLGTTEIE